MRKFVFKVTGQIEWALAFFFGAAMVVLTLIQVIMRYVFNNPPPWSEELARVCFIWVVYIGMSMACRRQAHVNVDYFEKLLPASFHKWTKLVSNLLMLVFLAIMMVSGVLLVTKTSGMMLTSVKLPVGVSYVSIALMGIIMTVYYLFFTYDSLRALFGKSVDALKSAEPPCEEV